MENMNIENKFDKIYEECDIEYLDKDFSIGQLNDSQELRYSGQEETKSINDSEEFRNILHFDLSKRKTAQGFDIENEICDGSNGSREHKLNCILDTADQDTSVTCSNTDRVGTIDVRDNQNVTQYADGKCTADEASQDNEKSNDKNNSEKNQILLESSKEQKSGDQVSGGDQKSGDPVSGGDQKSGDQVHGGDQKSGDQMSGGDQIERSDTSMKDLSAEKKSKEKRKEHSSNKQDTDLGKTEIMKEQVCKLQKTEKSKSESVEKVKERKTPDLRSNLTKTLIINGEKKEFPLHAREKVPQFNTTEEYDEHKQRILSRRQEHNPFFIECKICIACNDAFWRCKECDDVMCRRCQRFHALSKRTRHHTYTLLDRKDACPKHPGYRICVLCTCCNESCCGKCQVENHKNHPFVASIEEIYRSGGTVSPYLHGCAFEARLDAQMEIVEAQIDIINDKMTTSKEVLKSNRESITSEFHAFYDKLIDLDEQFIKEKAKTEEDFKSLDTTKLIIDKILRECREILGKPDIGALDLIKSLGINIPNLEKYMRNTTSI